tara:strand:- start:547 stop:1023 length:477 start_codon:yes stop_codon:yes gene_type:complete
MGSWIFLGEFLLTFIPGSIALYYSDLDDLLKGLILLLVSGTGILIFIINLVSEKGYTLKKLVDDYKIKYGDTVNFTFHIKTANKESDRGSNKIKKCKITGSVEKDALKIKSMTDCDEDKDIKEKYLKLITTEGEFDNKEPIRVGSKIANFTDYGNIFD